MATRQHKKDFHSTDWGRMSKQQQLQIDGLVEVCEETSFRPIHYLGSKMRLLKEIEHAAKIASPNGRLFCDLFSGSATVSFSMSKSYDVTSIDVQEYSAVLASALICHSRPSETQAHCLIDALRGVIAIDELFCSFEQAIKFETDALARAKNGSFSDIAKILENGSVRFGGDNTLPYMQSTRNELIQKGYWDVPSALVSSYYGGIYFSYRQAVAIDVIRNWIDVIADPSARNTCLAALVSTVSDRVNTIGKQFAQPIRVIKKNGTIKENLIGKIITDRSVDLVETYCEWLLKYCRLPEYKTEGSALKGPCAEVLSSLHAQGKKFDVIYADPPYTRDHYSRFYHLLETICIRDLPVISETMIKGIRSESRGLYRTGRHQSEFCIKTQAPGAFTSLFLAARKFNCPLLISYSPFSKANADHPRLMDIDEIVELGRQHYCSSTVKFIGDFAHSKLNSADNNKKRVAQAEVIITFIP